MNDPANDILSICEEAKALLSVLRESADLAGRNWFSVNDAAKYTGLSVKSIRRLISAGKLPASRPLPGTISIERCALDRYMRTANEQSAHPRGHALHD